MSHFIFGILILLASLFSHAGKVEVCVLYHERTSHPFMKDINEVFGHDPRVVVIKEALPIDILKCLEYDPQEILIFSHAFEISEQGDVRLGYFTRSTPEQAQRKFYAALRQFSDLHYQNQRNGVWPCADINQNEIPCTEAEIAARNVDNTYYALQKMKRSDLVYNLIFEYDKKVFHQRPFELLQDQLRHKPDARLKKIRLMSCEPAKIFAAYPALKTLLVENQIELDIAPRNTFLSFLYRKNVTTVDQAWLRKSLK